MNWHYPQTLLHWILAASVAAVAAFFAAGLTLYFERSPRPSWVLAIHYLSMGLALAQVGATMFLEPRSDALVFVAIIMYLAAIVLFLSAIEAAQRTRLQRSFVDAPLPDRLITDGPFGWVRHPFCDGYLLAAPVATHGPVIAVLSLFVIGTYVVAARREERQLEDRFGDAYRTYRHGTGMIVPSLARLFAGRSSH